MSEIQSSRHGSLKDSSFRMLKKVEEIPESGEQEQGNMCWREIKSVKFVEEKSCK